MSFIKFQEDIRWTLGFKRPTKQQFGIWRRKEWPTLEDGFYLIDWDKGMHLGMFDRQQIFRAYVRANSWMEAGDPQSWNFGFYVCFNQHQPVQGQFQDYQEVDASTVSPALAFYKWSENLPITFDAATEKNLFSGKLNELAAVYPILNPVDSLSIGRLTEARNFHKKDALVLSHNQKPGALYAIVDEIENYPELQCSER